MLKFAVVIPCLNEAARISRAIRSAQAAGAAEVIVADGGSQDESVDRARGSGAVVLSAARGRALQMNAGANQAHGDVLLFLHADAELPCSAGQQIDVALRDPRRIWGAFRQRIAARGAVYRVIEWGNAARVRWQRSAYGDQAIFVRKTAFDSIGGFDSVPLMEDVRLSRRLAKLAPPVLLEGPVSVDPRRWQRTGPVRQTLHNWWLLGRFRLGASPEQLAPKYRRHDEG
jgi:rSAM/selenodomain-associated transferase 2